jgi:glycosyltransferase involved in cell wall biosynthesis
MELRGSLEVTRTFPQRAVRPFRVAVFTNEFPARVSTFFARDMRGLIEAGLEIDVFPVRPLRPEFWSHVPHILGPDVLAPDRVHNLTFREALLQDGWPALPGARFARQSLSLLKGALPGGIENLAKTAYVVPKTWSWASRFRGHFDHILAYWGNYAATAALLFRDETGRRIPLTMFLHAGTDLYRAHSQLRVKLAAADNIVVVCDFNRRFLRDRYPDLAASVMPKVHVHHPGLDLAEFEYGLDGRQSRRVVAVGSLTAKKGFDVLLRAAGGLLRRGVEVEVELVGDGEEAASLHRLANLLGIASRVTFRGWLPFEKVRRAIGEATLLVHPSTGLGDAVPTVIKEAMALGTPVIASDVAGIPELLDAGACGVLVPPNDSERLAREIERLLSSEGQRHGFARRARQRAEELFDVWRNGRRLAEIMRATRRTPPPQLARRRNARDRLAGTNIRDRLSSESGR